MSKDINTFYLNQKEPNSGCLLALRSILLNFDSNITETVKYGMPCFCYSNKMFCYLWLDKKSNWPYLLWVDGNRIDHPDLEQGTRKRMKVLMINPNIDIPINKLQDILEQAIKIRKENYKWTVHK